MRVAHFYTCIYIHEYIYICVYMRVIVCVYIVRLHALLRTQISNVFVSHVYAA